MRYSGLEVVVDKSLAGIRKAVLLGGRRLVVSPAMYALMDGATPAEMGHLFRNLPFVAMPDPADLLTLPITTVNRSTE